MSNQIKIKIPKIRFKFKGIETVLDNLIKLNDLVVLVALLTLPLWMGSTSSVLTLALVLIGLNLLIRLFAKGEQFLMIPFDIQTIGIISITTLSVFYSVVIRRLNTNVWGGPSSEISGVTFIAYWFIYYIFALTFIRRKFSTKFHKYIFLSPLLTFFIILFANWNLYTILIVSGMFLTPALMLINYEKLLSKSNLLPILVAKLGFIAMFFVDTDAILTVIIILILLSIIHAVVNGIKQIKTYTNLKFITLVIIALILMLKAAFFNKGINLALDYNYGFNAFNNAFEGLDWVFGILAPGFNGVISTKFFYFYGFLIIPFVLLVLYQLIKVYTKTEKLNVKSGLVLFLSVIVYAFFTRDLNGTFIFLPITLAYISSDIYLDNNKSPQLLKVNRFESIKTENLKELAHILRYISVLALVAIIYIAINYIWTNPSYF